MNAPQSHPYFINSENEDDHTIANSQYYSHGNTDLSHSQGTPVKDESGPESKPVSGLNTLQKRRRVTRACDECRRKKIKCDGKQPCTHCTVYSYECTFDQPSNRRRNPAPQYVEALETRLHKAEALLRVVMPDLNLDDPQFDVHATEKLLAVTKKDKQAPENSRRPSAVPQPTSADSGAEGGDEPLLETMVDNSGCLDVDDQGHWDYHGHTSGITFIRRLRKQLGATEIQLPIRTRSMTEILDSPKSADSPPDATLPPTHDLPPRAVAHRLCHNALDDGCSLMRFVHEPSFYAMLNRIYDTPLERFTNEENTYLPLLYIVMSVGCLFSGDEAGTLNLSGYESAIDQGFQFFKAGRHLLDITDCRDLTSLQTICFMVLFLQSSAKLSTCYSYIGIALRSALRLGLHRSVAANFNPIEREMRKRVFWVIRKMDAYVSTLLGQPQMLSDDDIDQEYPVDVDSEFISVEGITPMPAGRTPLMAGSNAHIHLANIIMKVVRYIYPVKHAQRSKVDQHYMVSHTKIREIERDLQAWMEKLPSALRPGTEVPPQFERVRQLLRIGYAHVQMVMYRPFLHYVSSGAHARGVDKRSYACAAACVSVARNIVHITAGMHKSSLLNGSYWFTMYTTYFAILSLVFFVLENPDSPTAKDGVLKDAMEGKNTLAGLAKKSLAADRCSQSLNAVFKNLPEMLKKRQSSRVPVNLKRPAPSSKPQGVKAEPTPLERSPQRASTLPTQLLSRLSANDTSHAPKSRDDHTPSRAGTWAAPTPELVTETVSTPSETLSADQLNPPSGLPPLPSSMPGQDLSGLPLSQQFGNLENMPDLMPIMFPSDDPFAYPTQPMSTLEDGHFRQDGVGAESASFGLGNASQHPTVPATQAGEASGTTMGPAFDNFSNFPVFHGMPTGMGAPVPSHLQHRHQMSQSQRQSQRQSPASHSPALATGEPVSSPDLVSIPNQNFAWQNYNFQTQGAPNQSAPQQMPAINGSQGFDMGMEDSDSMGMGLDLGIPLDDILGNDACRPAGSFNNDDWLQWMNVGG